MNPYKIIRTLKIKVALLVIKTLISPPKFDNYYKLSEIY